MKNTYRPPLSEARFTQGFTRMSAVVGAQWASSQATETQLYVDPYNPGPENEFIPSGYVAPSSVDEVQALVRLANETGIPLWPISTGKNLTYGGPAPRMPGTVTLDLKRMNRVLEVDDDLAYAVVEPGVSFFDLYNHLVRGGHKLISSCPAPGWGSIIGNGLERGVGQTPYSEHIANSCGFEVVMPNGELLRTGMGAMDNAETFHLHPYGYGPDVHGLFAQSNYGVVTKMGRWLIPQPEVMMPVEIVFHNETDLPAIVERIRPLRQDGTIPMMGTLFNSVLELSMRSSRLQWYDGEGAVPPQALARAKSELGIGEWSLQFALYGREKQVNADWEVIEQAFSDIEGVEYRLTKYYDGDEIVHPAHQNQAGIPHMAAFGWLNWRQSGAHIDFSPVAPSTGAHAQRQYELIRNACAEEGFDCSITFGVEPRFMRMIYVLVFDRYDEAEKQRARAMFERLIGEFAAEGYGENRTHLAFMDAVAQTYSYNNHALLNFQENIKDMVDPNGILAPGKQGIWPAIDRTGRG